VYSFRKAATSIVIQPQIATIVSKLVGRRIFGAKRLQMLAQGFSPGFGDWNGDLP
jgi:hypothetical protein